MLSDYMMANGIIFINKKVFPSSYSVFTAVWYLTFTSQSLQLEYEAQIVFRGESAYSWPKVPLGNCILIRGCLEMTSLFWGEGGVSQKVTKSNWGSGGVSLI